jgi:hypothetical protein
MGLNEQYAFVGWQLGHAKSVHFFFLNPLCAHIVLLHGILENEDWRWGILFPGRDLIK